MGEDTISETNGSSASTIYTSLQLSTLIWPKDTKVFIPKASVPEEPLESSDMPLLSLSLQIAKPVVADSLSLQVERLLEDSIVVQT